MLHNLLAKIILRYRVQTLALRYTVSSHYLPYPSGTGQAHSYPIHSFSPLPQPILLILSTPSRSFAYHYAQSTLPSLLTFWNTFLADIFPAGINLQRFKGNIDYTNLSILGRSVKTMECPFLQTQQIKTKPQNN